ncbi:MAG: helix-turn-helix domain-containing protein [Bacteroidota bacterium]|nr:helix-turn-helix domain-containing protein [Bacteroidota bacterium]MDX5447740.1 helix-turn-helix domain-containing protein [Bacteroidota bacterium]
MKEYSIDIGSVIRERLENEGMTKAEFARRLNRSPQTIHDIFSRKSIHIDLLFEISEILRFDFFEYVSRNLSFDSPGKSSSNYEGGELASQASTPALTININLGEKGSSKQRASTVRFIQKAFDEFLKEENE